jgi:adenosylcobinamide-GDP ribazoletransferase
MTAISRFVREYLLAVQFFTRIPVTGRLAGWVGYTPELMRASIGHFPGIGLVAGAVAASVFAVIITLLPDTAFTPFVAAALSTVATALLTGGFHEDGLADVADGLGGSHERERALDIMKDSRIGAFGALALTLALLVKTGLLSILAASGTTPAGWLDASDRPDLGFIGDAASWPAGWYACAALVAGHVVSRGLPMVLIYLLPHVGNTAASKSKPVSAHMSPGRLAIGFIWCFSALALVACWVDASDLIAGCCFSLIAMLWMGRMFKRRLQGFTGDCLGATQQVCEIAFYLGLAISA